MRKGIMVAIGGLVLLAGCDTGNKANVPIEPKWKGAPYRIAFDAPPAKPNPTGVTIPAVKYTANPEALENRAKLVVRFDAAALTKQTSDGPLMNQMVMAPIDIRNGGGRPSRGLHGSGEQGSVEVSRGLLRQGKNKSVPGAGEVIAYRPSHRR